MKKLINIKHYHSIETEITFEVTFEENGQQGIHQWTYNLDNEETTREHWRKNDFLSQFSIQNQEIIFYYMDINMFIRSEEDEKEFTKTTLNDISPYIEKEEKQALEIRLKQRKESKVELERKFKKIDEYYNNLALAFLEYTDTKLTIAFLKNEDYHYRINGKTYQWKADFFKVTLKRNKKQYTYTFAAPKKNSNGKGTIPPNTYKTLSELPLHGVVRYIRLLEENDHKKYFTLPQIEYWDKVISALFRLWDTHELNQLIGIFYSDEDKIGYKIGDKRHII